MMIFRILLLVMICNTALAQRHPSLKYFKGSDKALQAQAKSQRRAFIIYFAHPRCEPCKELDSQSLNDPRVVRHLNQNFLIKKKKATHTDKIKQLPSLLFYDADAKIIKKLDASISVDPLLALMDSIAQPLEDPILHLFEGHWGAAKKSGQPFVAIFVEPWTASSRMLTKETLKDPIVVQKLNQRFVSMIIDPLQKKQEKLIQKLKLKTFPSYVFFDSKGKMIGIEYGYRNPRDFLLVLDKYLLENKKKSKIPFYRGTYEDLIGAAYRYQKPFVLFFGDDDAVSRQYLKSLSDPLVSRLIRKHFIIYQAPKELLPKLQKIYQNQHLPALIFLDHHGTVQGIEIDYQDPTAMYQVFQKYLQKTR